MERHPSRRWQRFPTYAVLGMMIVLGTCLNAGVAKAQQTPPPPCPLPLPPSCLLQPVVLPPTTGGGGGHNIVIVTNQQNGSTQIRGMVQLNRVPGPSVAPRNIAMATNSCMQQCQSLAIALQISVTGQNTPLVTPENFAIAANIGCTGCVAAAVAIQHVVRVPDPTKDLPPDIQAFINELNREVTAVSMPGMDLCTAVLRVKAVIDRFNGYAVSHYDEQIKVEPLVLPCLP